MTRDEGWDVTILLRWLGAHGRPGDSRVNDATAADSIAALAKTAAATIGVDIDEDRIYVAFEQHCERLRGSSEAELVCEALARHVAHGGTIPWPQVEVPFGNWAAARQEVST